MSTYKSKPLVVYLELEEIDEEGNTELQVGAIFGGAPGDGNKRRSDAAWAYDFIADHGLMQTIFDDDKLPPEVEKADSFVVVGRMVAESYETDCGTEHDAYFELERVLTEEQVVQALLGATT